MKPVIFGLAGPELTPDERALFAEVRPAGYILFRRNLVDRAQVLALTDALRGLHGDDDLAILIDQEGGRVARMQAPEWPVFPAPGAFETLYDLAPISAIEAARANAHAIGLMLSEVGITVNCLPLLDVRVPETHAAIGDRALSSNALWVASLGAAVLDGLRAGGVVGVVKHMPGQGRARVDSHLDLPVVDAAEDALENDLMPFARLHDAPIGMTAHVIYQAWDADNCATMSSAVIDNIIRGRIGFSGLLLSDDLDMQALSGPVADRAVACVKAGCDIALNCWARLDEMHAIADALPDIGPRSAARLAAALMVREPNPDYAAFDGLVAKRDALLALA